MLSSAIGATLIPCTTLQIYPQVPQLAHIFFGSDQSNSFRFNSILGPGQTPNFTWPEPNDSLGGLPGKIWNFKSSEKARNASKTADNNRNFCLLDPNKTKSYKLNQAHATVLEWRRFTGLTRFNYREFCLLLIWEISGWDKTKPKWNKNIVLFPTIVSLSTPVTLPLTTGP